MLSRRICMEYFSLQLSYGKNNIVRKTVEDALLVGILERKLDTMIFVFFG